MTRASLVITPPPLALSPGRPDRSAPARKPLAIVTIVPTLRGKPRAHYGRILIGPKHAAAVARRFRMAELGEFGGFLTFAITGERQDG